MYILLYKTYSQIEENLWNFPQIKENIFKYGNRSEIEENTFESSSQIEENTFEYMCLFEKDLVGPYNSFSYKPYT